MAERLRCIPRILALRNRQLGGRLGAEQLADVAQDVALAVWRRLDGFEGRAKLESWVWRFCVLELMNALRRTSRQASRLEEEAAVESPRPTRVDATDDDSLEPYLRHLSPREAQVVRLRHVDQLTLDECGDALGIAKSSVKTHYARALEKLRALTPLGERRDGKDER